jgi:hypothetical protein
MGNDGVTRASSIVLVEGVSDQVAVETIARRRGRELDAEGVAVVAIGGAQAIGRCLAVFGPGGLGARLAGLCDAGEERAVRRALAHAGVPGDRFHVCVADLEDELVRAVGAPRVEELLEEQGELRSFRTFQKQDAHRGAPRQEQLHRFMHNRKIRYARLLGEAFGPDDVPQPLDALLAGL